MANPYTYAEGYDYGYTGEDPRGETIGRMSYREARTAVLNWRSARSDHAHASFWGFEHIREMRAYWLGYARGRLHGALMPTAETHGRPWYKR